MSSLSHAKGVNAPRGFDPDVLFVIEDEDTFGEVRTSYVRTPDGIGAYWYDDRTEAEGDVSDPIAVRTFESQREFEDWRAEQES